MLLNNMVTRTITFSEGEHYHVYNRGNSKQKIFLSQSDFDRFIQLLYLSNTTARFNVRDVLKTHNSVFEIHKPDSLVELHAVCLMPNHFHLIVTPLDENGLSRFMLKLATAYSMSFNTKYKRTGSLFESRFKAKNIDEDRYLKYLFSYIHMNPLSLISIEKKTKHEQFKFLYTYPHSSLSSYVNQNSLSPRAALGLSELDKVVDTKLFEMYFEDKKKVEEELFNWITFDDEPALGLP